MAVYTWGKYIPMYNIEFSRFLNPDGLYPYYNFAMSLSQFFLYLVVMYMVSYKFFEKYQG